MFGVVGCFPRNSMHAFSVAQLCTTLCDPIDCSLPGFSIHGIFQARMLEWVAISSSRGSSWPWDRTRVSCIGRQILYHWVIWESPQKFHRLRQFYCPLLFPCYCKSYLCYISWKLHVHCYYNKSWFYFFQSALIFYQNGNKAHLLEQTKPCSVCQMV